MDHSSLRDQIAAFQADYIRCIDNDELEHWPEFFSEDGHYSVTTAANVKDGLPAGLIRATNRAMLQDRVSALRHANVYERHGYRHIVGLPSAKVSEPGRAEAETPFMVARIMHDGQTQLFATGVYRDVFELDGSRLRLQSRVVICDSSRIDTLLAVPL